MDSVIACHECDLLHQRRPLPPDGTARCVRCGAVLYRRKRNSLDRVLSLTVAGLILFIIANAYPFLTFRLEAQIQQTNLITGVMELYQQGMWIVAGVVLLTTIGMPPLEACPALPRGSQLPALGDDGSLYDRHPGGCRKTCQNGQHHPGHSPLCFYGPYFYTCGISRCA